jgi:hypothetical protein
MLNVPRGAVALIEVDFTDDDGSPVDPATVALTVRKPDGSTQLLTDMIEHVVEEVGHYSAPVVASVAGSWYYRWETTGTGTVGVLEGYFFAEPAMWDPPWTPVMPPEAPEVRSESTIDFAAQGIDDRAYLGWMREAVSLVQSLTGRALDASLPAALRPLALRAVRMKTEKVALLGAAKQRSSSITGGNLRSISAGPWSESYFGPGEAASAKVLDPDPALNEVLWALATDDMRDYWRELWGMAVRPAAAVQGFDWGLAPGGYRRSSLGLGGGVGPGVPGYPPPGWE